MGSGAVARARRPAALETARRQLVTARASDAKQRAHTRLSTDLAAVRPGRRCHPCGLCHSRLARLRDAGRPPTAGRRVWLPDGWYWLRSGWLVSISRGRTDFSNLADDCKHGCRYGGRGHVAVRSNCHRYGFRRRPLLPARLGVETERVGQADKRQRADRIQSRCRSDHRHYAVAGVVRRQRRWPQRARAAADFWPASFMRRTCRHSRSVWQCWRCYGAGNGGCRTSPSR